LPRPTLFPYTTLFRSLRDARPHDEDPSVHLSWAVMLWMRPGRETFHKLSGMASRVENRSNVRCNWHERSGLCQSLSVFSSPSRRSEEHTSELQSRGHL